MLGARHFQRVEILIDGVGRAEIPVLVDALLGMQNIEKLTEFAAKKTMPSKVYMTVETDRFVLRQHKQLAQSAVHAVGESEINDSIAATKWNRRLRTIASQWVKPRTFASRQDHRHHVANSRWIDFTGSHRPHS